MKDGIGVVIGEENTAPELQNCSMVLSSSSDEGTRTILGVIGPKRMNYARVISVLDSVLCDMEGAEGDE